MNARPMALMAALVMLWAALGSAVWYGYLPVPAPLRQMWDSTAAGQVLSALRSSPGQAAEPAQPPATPARFATPTEPQLEDQVRALLYATRYAELEELLERVHQDYVREAANEYRLYQAYAAFGGEEARLREEIDAWVQARPDAYQARLGRAVQRVELAWVRRGRKFSRDVAPEAKEDFVRLLQLAGEDIEAVLAATPGHPLAWRARIRIAGGVGGASAAFAQGEGLARDAPGSYLAHKALINFLQPRWGGSYAAMESYAAQAQVRAGENPQLGVLLGFPYWARAKDIEERDDYDNAIAYYDKALAYGDEAYFLQDRSDALLKLLRFKEAMADMQRENQRFPTHKTRKALDGAPDRMRKRAYELHRAQEHVRAMRAYDAFLELWPDDEDVLLYQAQILADLNRYAEALRNFRRVIQLNPTRFEAVQGADHALAREQRWNEILPLWNAYIERTPDKAEAYMERGGTYFHMQDMAEAYANAARACELGLETGCAWKARLATHPAARGS